MTSALRNGSGGGGVRASACRTRRRAATIHQFRFVGLQPNQDGPEDEQPDEEKNKAALVMELSGEEAGVNVDGEERERDDANPVLNDDHGHGRHQERGPRPFGAQEKIAGQKAGNEQRDGGADAAAFRRYVDGGAGQGKNEALAKHRGCGGAEEPIGNFGGAHAEPADKDVNQRFWEGNGEKQKKKRKLEGMKRLRSIEEQEPRPYQEDQRQDGIRHEISAREKKTESPAQAEEKHSGEEKYGGGSRAALRVWGKPVPVHQHEAGRDDGDQEDVRINVLREREVEHVAHGGPENGQAGREITAKPKRFPGDG